MKSFIYPLNKGVIKSFTLVLILIFFIVFFMGCSILPEEEEVHTSSILVCDEVDYEIHEVTRGELIYKIEGHGIFVSPKYNDCKFEYGGDIIEAVLVKEGDRVNKGDVLIELDKGDLEYQLKEQKLRLDAVKKDYNNLNSYDAKKTQMLLEIEEKKLNSIIKEIEGKKIRSAMDGTIIYSSEIIPGERIVSNELLFRIADTKDLQLMFINYKKKDMSVLKNNMEVKIFYNNIVYNGKAVGKERDVIDNGRESANEGYWIKMDNLPSGAGFGSSVEMTLELINKKDVIAIPKKALKVKDEKYYVIVLENGVRTKKDVKIGSESDLDIEITKGLKEGDKVILN